ncbi:aspartic peptidase domain-containing protein, partial [Amylocarpus encephaloides]
MPYVFQNTGDWNGNDGSWSTFAIQIGTPPQTLKVQMSTSGTQIAAIAPEGCGSGDSVDCRKLRGEFFNYNDSTTYVPNLSNISSSIYHLGVASKLGYTGKGRFGFDDVTLGWQGSGGPTVKNQTVAGIATKDFYMGWFGLNPRPNNFTDFNHPIPSFMQNIRNQSMIPSLSWGYTAGNRYRSEMVQGSVVLGGYDAARFIPSNVTFNLGSTYDLGVQLRAITTNNSISLHPHPVQIALDSTVPHLYLPNATCDLFETEFGLVYNETSRFYWLNETQHAALLTKNPSVEFTLSAQGSTQEVKITLPYAAFDLAASAPLAPTPTYYFPLRRAVDESQYLLGRAFFQEAYLIADYDRGNFSIHQCNWQPTSQSLIVALHPPTNATTSGNHPKKISTGALSGAVAGAAAVVIIACVLLHIFCWKPRQVR